MDLTSEVVIRQIDLLQDRVLFVNAPTDDLLSQLNDNIKPSIWCWNFNDFQYFQNQQSNVHFGVDFPEGQFDQAVIFVPKSKELLNYLLQFLPDLLHILRQHRSVLLLLMN